MSNLFECACRNSGGLVLNGKGEISQKGKEVLSRLNTAFDVSWKFRPGPGFQYEHWKARKLDLGLTHEVGLLSSLETWYGFCVSPDIRKSCLLHAKALCACLEANSAVFMPERAGLATDVMDGWKWEQILDELERQYGAPADKKLFDFLSDTVFTEAEEDNNEDNCYFELTVKEMDELILRA